MSKFNERNPFIAELQNLKTGVRTAICAKGNMVSLVDYDTGEIKGSGFNAVVKEKQYDSERFVKLYTAGRDVLPKLSVSATKLLWYFIDHMGYDDVVIINMPKAMKETGYKNETAIYRAIAELRRHNVLANAFQNGMYYINPAMFYRGNRLKLLKE